MHYADLRRAEPPGDEGVAARGMPRALELPRPPGDPHHPTRLRPPHRIQLINQLCRLLLRRAVLQASKGPFI